jgi:hypothetical protein
MPVEQSKRIARLCRAGAAAVATCAGLAWGQDAGDASAKPVAALLLVEREPLSAFLVDAKDEQLARALAMIPARMKELPGDVPDMPAAASDVI